MFVPGKPLLPSVMFVGKTVSLPEWSTFQFFINQFKFLLSKILSFSNVDKQIFSKFYGFQICFSLASVVALFLAAPTWVWVNQRTHFPLTPMYFPLLPAFLQTLFPPIMMLACYQQAGSGKWKKCIGVSGKWVHLFTYTPPTSPRLTPPLEAGLLNA